MSKFTLLSQYNALQQANDDYWFDEQGVLHGKNITWKPLPENGNQPIIIPRSFVLHSNANPGPVSWETSWNYCARPDITLDPTFDISNSGKAGQFMSAYRRSDCNYSANSWTFEGKLYGALSIETADLGHATLDRTPWNLDQLATIIAITTAGAVQLDTGCNEVLSIYGKGIDYHTKFPYVAPGIPAWTNVKGKTCPGKARKLQLPYIRNEVAKRVAKYLELCQKMGIPHGIAGL